MNFAADPFITIVIPVYNRETLVMRTLKSLEGQTCRRFSVVLVDNNSTDATLHVLNEWAARQSDISVDVISESTPGAAAARNAGLARVTTEWTMFFDSDDVMYGTHVARVAGVIERIPDADLITWDVRAIYLNGTTCTLPSHDSDLLYHNLMHGSLSTQRYCARTELFRAVGGWNEDVLGWDDIELGTRLLPECNPAVVHDGTDITVDVYETAESISGIGYAHGATRFDHALDVVTRSLPDKRRHWVELKRIILAADCAREGAAVATELRRKALDNTRSWSSRQLLRAAYLYRRLGLPGIARLLRPVI